MTLQRIHCSLTIQHPGELYEKNPCNVNGRIRR